MELLTFLPLIIIMGAFLYFSSRRQRKLVQATIDLQESLQVGERVITTSGLQGTIAAIVDDTVDLEIAPGVVTRWIKLAIRDRVQIDEIDEIDEIDGIDGIDGIEGDSSAAAPRRTEPDRLAND